MLITLIFISVFFLIPGDDLGSAENPVQASLQIMNNSYLLLAILVSTLVIGPFNYFGTSLTKYASAMHRCLIDSSRMCIIWFIAICCSWENFTLLQSLGYFMVVLGNLVFYEIILGPEKSLPMPDSPEQLPIKNSIENAEKDELNNAETTAENVENSENNNNSSNLDVNVTSSEKNNGLINPSSGSDLNKTTISKISSNDARNDGYKLETVSEDRDKIIKVQI